MPSRQDGRGLGPLLEQSPKFVARITRNIEGRKIDEFLRWRADSRLADSVERNSTVAACPARFCMAPSIADQMVDPRTYTEQCRTC